MANRPLPGCTSRVEWAQFCSWRKIERRGRPLLGFLCASVVNGWADVSDYGRENDNEKENENDEAGAGVDDGGFSCAGRARA